MAITYSEAIQALQAHPELYATQAALAELAASVTLDAQDGLTQGRTTILYSGEVDSSIHSGTVVQQMIEQGADIRVLDKTQVSALLTSDEFRKAWGATEGLTLLQMNDATFESPAKAALFHATDGPWAEASKRFASATMGEVRIIAPYGDAARVLGATELPTILENANVTTIDGIARTQLLDLQKVSGLDSVRRVVFDHSMVEVSLSGLAKGNIEQYLALKPDSYGQLLKDAGRFNEVDRVLGAMPAERLATFRSDMSALIRISERPVSGLPLSKSLNKLGLVGGVLGFLAAGHAAAAERRAGNMEAAERIMAEWAADAAGSEIGSSIGTAVGGIALAIAAAAGVTVSAPLVAVVLIGAGLIGGLFGGRGGVELYRLLHDSDGNGRRDLMDKLSNFLFGAESTSTPLVVDVNGGKFTIDASLTEQELVANAMRSMAWRFALRELNPFVISDISYDRFNTDGSLDLVDPTTGAGSMTREYLRDRAAMLAWKLRYERKGAQDADDLARTGPKPYNEDWDTSQVSGNWDYADLTLRLPGGAPLQLSIDGSGISLHDHQIVFGSLSNDTISGEGVSDRLYGGAGDDTLDGKAGDDYLEGGAGADNYDFAGSFGKDVIFDSDGKGAIRIDGGDVGEARAAGERDTWRVKLTNDKVAELALRGDTTGGGHELVITVQGSPGNSVTVRNFDLAKAQGGEGYLGIKLETANRIALLSEPRNFWEDPGVELSDLAGRTETIPEHGGTTFTVSLNQAARPGETVAVQLLGLSGKGLRIVANGQAYSADSATLALQQGQTQVTFALLHDGSLQADALGAIKAVFNGQASTSESNTWALVLQDVADVQNSFDGDFTKKLEDKQRPDDPDRYEFNQSGNYVVDPNNPAAPGAADVIRGTDQADRMRGFGGDDLLLGGEGADELDGGEGDDVLQGGLGSDTLLGGGGTDFIYGSSAGSFLSPDKPDWTLASQDHPVLSQGFGWAVLLDGVDNDSMPAFFLTSEVQRDKQDDDQGNTIDAGEGDDFVAAGTGDDQVEGGGGSDDIYGMAGRDVLSGGEGNDRIHGDGPSVNGGGNGTTVVLALPGDHQADVIDGGAGNDLLIGQGAGDHIDGGTGDDTIFGDDRNVEDTPVAVHGDDDLDGGDGSDSIFGGGGNDSIHGGADDDTLLGDDIAQRLPGDAHGDDFIDGDLGNDTLLGGGGSDTLVGGEGDDQMHGDAHDLEAGFDGDDLLYGDAGNDVLVGGGAADHLYGGVGNDTLLGDGEDMAHADLSPERHGDDALVGGDGDDRLVGGGGSDTLLGGLGADLLVGDGNGAGASVEGNDSGASSPFEGDDRLDGGDGNDILRGGGGADVLLGGSGADEISGDAGDDNLEGGAGTDTLYGGAGNDNLDGGAEEDLLWGAAGDDILDGGDSDDQLDGGDGDDALSGGAGQDILVSGGGNDVLDGGEGNDGYVVSTGAGHVDIDASSGDDLVTFEQELDVLTLVGSGTAEELTLVLSTEQSVTVRGPAYLRIGNQTYHSSVLAAVLNAGSDDLPAPPQPGAQTSVANLTDSDGRITGSVLRSEEPSGRTTTVVYAGADGTGLKISSEWTDPDGSRGSARYDADGFPTGKTIRADGSYTVFETWDEGTYSVTYSPQGLALRDDWTDTAGPLAGGHGYSVWNADGTYRSVEYAADGSYRTFTHWDGQVIDQRYDAAGNPLNAGRMNFQDGSYADVVNDGNGTITTAFFNAAQVRTGQRVRLPDGSHGTTTFKPDGAFSSVLYRRDGTYSKTEADGEGQTIVREYTIGGRLLGSSVTQVNGLTSITSLLDASGKRIIQNWKQADGTTGTTSFSDFDYNGVRNHLVAASASNPEEYKIVRAPDGAYMETTNDDGDYFDEWYTPGPGQNWATFNSVARGDGDMDPWFYAWLEDDKYYIEGGYDSPGFARFAGYYEFHDYERSLGVEAYLSPTGRKTIQVNSTTVDVGTSTSAVRQVVGSAGSGYAVLVEDGFGNVSFTSHDGTGRAVKELWIHNDGSYGADSYFADGSSSGVSAEPNSTFNSYRIGPAGATDVTVYPGDNAILTLAMARPPSIPTEVLVPAPPPTQLNAAPSSSYRYQAIHIERNSAEYRAIFDGQGQVEVTVDAQGALAVSGFVVITDPGFEAEVTVGASRYEWTYDVGGTPTGRVAHLPDGSIETYTVDRLGRVTGSSRSTVAPDGSVATLCYGNDGQFMGTSLVTQPDVGQTLTSRFTAGGVFNGSRLEVTDGLGNTVVSERDGLGNLIAVTTRVMTAGNESTITHYDGSGAPTGIEVTRVAPEGVIETSMRNGAGQLLEVVVAGVEADGSVTTSHFDPAGRLTGVVLSRITPDQDVTVTAYDAFGNMTSQDVLRATGVHEYSTHSFDGSRVRTVVQADGTYQIATRSAAGDIATAHYSRDGAKLSQDWTRLDGSSGTNTFNADGSSASTAIYRDGTRSTSTTDRFGVTTTTHRTALGSIAGTTVTRDTDGGGMESTSFNPAGVKTNSFWTKADGSRGEIAYATDGSFAGTVTQVNGSRDELAANAQGVVTVRRYDAAGALMATRTNHAPTASTVAVTTKTRPGEFLSFTLPSGVFADQDSGDVLRYEARLAGSAYLPDWMWFDEATGTFGGQPGVDDIGSFTIQVSATDRDGASVGKNVTVEVAGMRASPIADQAALEDQPWTFTVPGTAFQAQGSVGAVTYAASLPGGARLPAWLQFDPATRTFTGTPRNADTGPLLLTVMATDADGVAVESAFTIVVGNVNDTPVLATPIEDQAGVAGQAWAFALPPHAFVDADRGDNLALSASLADGLALPSWLNFDAATGVFSGTPPAGQAFALDVAVTAVDAAGASISTGFRVDFSAPAHQAPVVGQPIAAQAATEDAAWSFMIPSGAFVDADGDALSWSASLADGSPLPSWIAFDAAAGRFTGTPTNSQVGQLAIRLTATDPMGLQASQDFTLEVANSNDAPVAAAPIEAQQVTQDAAWRFTAPASAFTDVDAGDALGYTATLAGGEPLPTWITFDAITRTFTGIPTNDDVGALQVVVTATDLAGAAVSSAFELQVANVNDAPVVVGTLQDRQVVEASQFAFTVPPDAFADVDAYDTLAYSAGLADGGALPSWLTFDATTRTFTGTPERANLGDLVLTLTAADAAGATAAQTFTLTVTRAPGLTLIGTGESDRLVGGAGDDVIDGAAAADVMVGGKGDDLYLVDDVTDAVVENENEGADTVCASTTYLLGAGVENLILTGDALSNGRGNALDNRMQGNGQTNVLDGGKGADTMLGLGGNDLYIVDDSGDVVIENPGEGIDGVWASVSYALEADVEYLVLLDGDIDGTGNESANSLWGNQGANVLDGGAGADVMGGLGGNDTYIVDQGGDRIEEYAGGGNDTVSASLSWTLGANLENLLLTGSVAIDGTGNALANWMQGNQADNVLDGASGADVMLGGAGDDVYVVESAGDVVVESDGEGCDAVHASISYMLGANVESLALTGTAAIDGTGNTLDNWMQGNSAANILDGGTGADSMLGLVGNDSYIVDDAGDRVIENAGEGIDTVYASANHMLLDNVENVVLTGTANLQAVGNALANRLQGNAGDNTLDGGTGADAMLGGAGNDSYRVDNTGDCVTELAGEGIDTVSAAISHSLGANMENLVLTGTSAIDGLGNALANRLQGNDADNVLSGAGGSDYLDGKGGNDTLEGGAGADTYAFDRGSGSDAVIETATSTGDVGQFGSGIATDQLWFSKSRFDLQIQVIGTSDSLTVKNWYRGSGSNRLDMFTTSDGHVLTEARVQNLVNAMASFAPPPPGQITLSPEYQATLGATIAANWQ